MMFYDLIKKACCLIGCHDFIVLEESETYLVDGEIVDELKETGSYPDLYDRLLFSRRYFYTALRKKGCVDCGLITDEIKTYRERQTARIMKSLDKFGLLEIHGRRSNFKK